MEKDPMSDAARENREREQQWEREGANGYAGSMDLSALSAFVTGNAQPLKDMIEYADVEFLPKIIAAAVLAVGDRDWDEGFGEEMLYPLVRKMKERCGEDQFDDKKLAEILEKVIGLFTIKIK